MVSTWQDFLLSKGPKGSDIHFSSTSMPSPETRVQRCLILWNSLVRRLGPVSRFTLEIQNSMITSYYNSILSLSHPSLHISFLPVLILRSFRLWISALGNSTMDRVGPIQGPLTSERENPCCPFGRSFTRPSRAVSLH